MIAGKTAQLLNMPTALWVYIDDLRRTGLYGTSVSAVIRTLVQRGVQDAVSGRVIVLRDFSQKDGGE